MLLFGRKKTRNRLTRGLHITRFKLEQPVVVRLLYRFTVGNMIGYSRTKQKILAPNSTYSTATLREKNILEIFPANKDHMLFLWAHTAITEVQIVDIADKPPLLGHANSCSSLASSTKCYDGTKITPSE
jgi:hypothetical protein